MNNHQIGFKKKLPQRYLQKSILKFLKRKGNKKYSAKNIAHKLKVKNSKDSVLMALEFLRSREKVIVDKEGRYGINPHFTGKLLEGAQKVIVGVVDITHSGSAYVVPEEGKMDIFIPRNSMNGAMDRDTVLVSATFFEDGRKPRGRVLEIKERNRESFIGIFRDHKKYGYVYVDDRKNNLEVKVLPSDFNGAEDGDIVNVRILNFENDGPRHMIGRVIQKLNTSSKDDFVMQSILINNGFEIEFSEALLSHCESLSEMANDDDPEREDFRDVHTFTIDPVDAKDYDDALSVRILDNGHTEVGVHIADVTHYVLEDNLLDKEAQRRSTSVYLVDRVCPMLPEKLSNELCSLRPEEDKMTFSAIFEIDPGYKIVGERFAKTLIHSNRRFTYEEVQDILTTDKGPYVQEIKYLNEMAQRLKQDRFAKGSIDFASNELKVILNEEGVPIEIRKKSRKDAHKLVEEFMLLANKKVATFIHNLKKSKPPAFIYRIHDLPDPERLVELRYLADELDIKLQLDTPENIAKSLNSLSGSIDNEDLLAVLRPMAIRSMAKAAYSTENIGHYGLGFQYYTHFTSPIRRYSDILAHRILKKVLSNDKIDLKKDLETACKHISRKERDAINSERESVKYKQIQYLQFRIGEEFEGRIRNMIDRGIFVELIESFADGMIGFDRFNESYSLHAANIKAVGDRSGRIFKIGDRIKVKLLDANLDRLQLDLEFVK